MANREFTKSGYVYIYVSNESKDFKVYFDNLKVTHIRGPLLSEEGYYPFGMSMSAISSTAGTVAKNNYKFNAGTELTESFDINYYETYFREYDAQLGRFTGVDALIELNRDLTPYHYAMNDPVFWNDPTGLVCEYYLPEVVVYASRRSGSGVSWPEWGSILDQLEGSLGYNVGIGGSGSPETGGGQNGTFRGFGFGVNPPTAAPSKILGTTSYYRFRYNDFNERYANTGITAPDYYMEYGDKYVHRFLEETFDIVSTPGKIWVRKVLLQLQLAIEDKLVENPDIESESKDFKSFAFKSHVPIYKKAGFLELSVLDKVKIVLTPDLKDLLSPEGVQQAVEMGKEHAYYYLANPMFALKQGVEFFYNKDVITNLIKDYARRNGIDPFIIRKYLGLNFGF